ncbi:MAG: YigZ family protein [Acidaminobacteraceae bacterium]
MNYKTVVRESVSEDVINKSKFITYVKPVKTEEEATQFIEAIKKKHRDASHNVPVYLIGSKQEIQRYSDDGEPSGTAGVPIISMLKNEGITNLVIVVTRYFGGVKLGTGGLVRAYTNMAKIGLENSEIIDMLTYNVLDISFDYTLNGILQNYISSETKVLLKDSVFTEKVKIMLYVKPEDLSSVNDRIIDITNSKCDISLVGEEILAIKDSKIYNK